MPEAPWGRCTRWLTCLTIDPLEAGVDCEDVRLALEAANIEARPVWKPMHRQPVYSHYEVAGGSVSEYLFANGLCLPSGSAMTDEEHARVVDGVRRTFAHAYPWRAGALNEVNRPA
jgi:pyridoxal phosphate-dependent aminotransferase EpsN